MTGIIRKRLSAAGNDKGFTLIELLVVLVILGVLLAIAVPSYLGFQKRSNDSAAKADIRAAIPAMEAYYQDHDTYTAATRALLKASYDQGISPSVTVVSADDTSWCLSATIGGQSWAIAGPGPDMSNPGDWVNAAACS